MPHRHCHRSLALIVAAVCCSAFAAPSRTPAQDAATSHARADSALETFLLDFWSAGDAYLRHTVPGPSGPTWYWTFAQGFDALLDGVERTGGRRFAGLVETFYEAQDARGWLAGWYDDENWMALALLRAHALTGRAHYLDRALELFDDIRGGWDDTCCGDDPGGIWWDKAHTQKATASNAGPVITGVRIFEATGDTSALEFAEQVYTYWHRVMVDATTAQVIDHIETDGDKVRWEFTYNEGLMLGAAIELWRVTGNSRYLSHAIAIGNRLVASGTRTTALGRILDDGTNASCTDSCHAFKGIAFRYLALLFAERPVTAYGDVLAASARAIWELARATDTGLFAIDWAGPPTARSTEPQVASAVMALSIWAQHVGAWPDRDLEPGVFEAEEATLRGVGIAASRPGHSGFGHVTSSGSDGEEVEFAFTLGASSRYDLTMRYAADASAARRVTLDGEVLVARLALAATSDADAASWNDVAVDVELDAGEHRVRVVYDSARGSAGAIDLDRLVLVSLAPAFRRGDASADEVIDLTDAVVIVRHLFLGDPRALACSKAGDSDDNGFVDVSDALIIANWLFLGGRPPSPPSAACGTDPSDDGLACERPGPCA